jgi:hypothetical protein
MQALKTLAVALVLAAAVLTQAQSASAQVSQNGKDVDGQVAGIVGLGMIGADIGLILVPAVGLHDQKWAWAIFPIVLAGAGVGAGVAVADSVGPAADIAFLVSGMGLFVPALVGSLAWKSHKQDQELSAQRALIQMGRINLNAPSIAAAPVYSAQERQRYNVPQATSMRLTLLSGTF